MKEIKAGDVVQLKSGSPDMTVSRITEDTAYLVFFDDNGFFKDAYADRVALVKTRDGLCSGVAVREEK